MESRGAESLARLCRRGPALLQEPTQSARAYPVRQDDRRIGGNLRARDPALYEARMADPVDARRRRTRPGSCFNGMGTAVLQAAAIRTGIRAAAALSAAEDSDRRADVRPLRDAA